MGIKIFDGNNLRRERHNARINIENVRLEQTDAEQAVKADLYNKYNTKLCEISLMQISGKVSVYLQ